jgi:hypothetical protein
LESCRYSVLHSLNSPVRTEAYIALSCSHLCCVMSALTLRLLSSLWNAFDSLSLSLSLAILSSRSSTFTWFLALSGHMVTIQHVAPLTFSGPSFHSKRNVKYELFLLSHCYSISQSSHFSSEKSRGNGQVCHGVFLPLPCQQFPSRVDSQPLVSQSVGFFLVFTESVSFCWKSQSSWRVPQFWKEKLGKLQAHPKPWEKV